MWTVNIAAKVGFVKLSNLQINTLKTANQMGGFTVQCQLTHLSATHTNSQLVNV